MHCKQKIRIHFLFSCVHDLTQFYHRLVTEVTKFIETSFLLFRIRGLTKISLLLFAFQCFLLLLFKSRPVYGIVFCPVLLSRRGYPTRRDIRQIFHNVGVWLYSIFIYTYIYFLHLVFEIQSGVYIYMSTPVWIVCLLLHGMKTMSPVTKTCLCNLV